MEATGPAVAPDTLALPVVPALDFTALVERLIAERTAWAKLDPDGDTATELAVAALVAMQAEVKAGHAQGLREALIAAGGDDLADALSALIVLEDA